MPSRKSISDDDRDVQPTLFSAAVPIFRYLLIISPSPHLIKEVRRLKQLVAQRIGSFRSDRSVAHITLLYAYLPMEYERTLCDGIEEGATGHPPFKLHFNGIAHFPDKRTIYLDPVEKTIISALRKSVRDRLRNDARLKKLGVHTTTRPHLTIARHLGPGQFEPAWEALAPHTHRSEEMVSSIVLLRSSVDGESRHDTVRTFPLK